MKNIAGPSSFFVGGLIVAGVLAVMLPGRVMRLALYSATNAVGFQSMSDVCMARICNHSNILISMPNACFGRLLLLVFLNAWTPPHDHRKGSATPERRIHR
ncbi:MAG: hypothetical protein R3C60_13105 [Parvularculaceae bacterium]